MKTETNPQKIKLAWQRTGRARRLSKPRNFAEAVATISDRGNNAKEPQPLKPKVQTDPQKIKASSDSLARAWQPTKPPGYAKAARQILDHKAARRRGERPS